MARELGVRYVIEGSVRRSTNRVRLNVQLIDASTGEQVWANRYDRQIVETFDLQDELATTLAGAVEPAIGKAERDRAKLRKADNLDTWDLYQRAMARLYERTRSSLAEAERLLVQVTERDSAFAPAYSGLASTRFYLAITGGPGAFSQYRDSALEAARRAVELDASDAGAHTALGRAHHLRGEIDFAIPALAAAIELNPSHAEAHYIMGAALCHSGRPQDGIPHLLAAIEFSPRDPILGSFYTRLAEAHLFLGRAEEALEWARKGLQQPSRTVNHYVSLISILGHLGRRREAAATIQELDAFQSGVTLAHVREHHTVKGSQLELLMDGLRKAGLPG